MGDLWITEYGSYSVAEYVVTYDPAAYYQSAHVKSAYGHHMKPLAIQPKLDLNTFELQKGGHQPGPVGCVMEFASQLAGEAWSDHPTCVSGMIASTLRSWNDSLNYADRQRLRPYAFRALDTNTTAVDDIVRVFMAVDWLVRVGLPALLDAASPSVATRLRAMPPVIDAESLVEPLALIAKAAAFATRWEGGDCSDVPPLETGVCAVLVMRGTVSILSGLEFSRLSDIAFGLAMYWRCNASLGEAVNEALFVSALGLVDAMCEVGRTPIVASKVKALATTHGREAWVEAGVTGGAALALAE